MRSKKLSGLVLGLTGFALLLLPISTSCSHSVQTPATTSPPVVRIVSESNPALPGPVTFFVSVNAPGVSDFPTGSVTFTDGSEPLDTVTLDENGLAICTASLAPGSHEISVSYSGDGNFAGAKSGSLTQNVTNADGTTVAPKTTTAAPPTYAPITDVPVVD